MTLNILPDLIPIFGIIFAVALPIALSAYLIALFLKNRHDERLEMIKSGVILDEVKKADPNVYTSLRNGFLFVGAGLGAIIGITTASNLDYRDEDFFVVLTSSIMLFVGIAYIIFYFVTKDKLDQNNRS